MQINGPGILQFSRLITYSSELKPLKGRLQFVVQLSLIETKRGLNRSEILVIFVLLLPACCFEQPCHCF